MRVVAQVLLLDDDAGELVAVLEQEVERLGRDVGLDRHVRARLVGEAGDDAPVDRARLQVDDLAEPPVERAQLGSPGGDRRDRHALGAAGLLAQLAALGLLRLRRLAPLGVREPALERPEVLRGLRAGGPRPRRAPCGSRRRPRSVVGHGVREDLHHRRGAGLDQRPAVAVDDVAARRLDLDLAHAVLAGLADVLVAGQHLQEPEPEEDDREEHERDAAEHGDAHRELRRDRRAAVLDRC